MSNKRLTTVQFIERAKAIHGDKYDYSKVKYVNAHTKVKLICQIHGEFLQTPDRHLCGCDCKPCSSTTRHTISQFITRARKIHGNKYDYSGSVYVNSHTKVNIMCPKRNAL
jgi:hypothetical protein